MKEPSLEDVLGKIFDEMFGENKMTQTEMAAKVFYETYGAQKLTIKIDENGITVKDPANKDVLPVMLAQFADTYIDGQKMDDMHVAYLIGLMSERVTSYMQQVAHNAMVRESQRGE